jgi:hypothetical protein
MDIQGKAAAEPPREGVSPAQSPIPIGGSSAGQSVHAEGSVCVMATTDPLR